MLGCGARRALLLLNYCAPGAAAGVQMLHSRPVPPPPLPLPSLLFCHGCSHDVVRWHAELGVDTADDDCTNLILHSDWGAAP